MEDLATRDIQLFIATEDTLLSESTENLHKKCREWGLPCEGSKQSLVERLIAWRDNYISQPSASASPQSPLDKSLLNPKKEECEVIDKDILSEDFGLVQYCNIPFEDITILTQLGTGSFKDCYRGLYFDVPVAICKFRTAKAKKKDIVSYRTELEIYKKTVHPNIISSYGVVGHQTQLILINEFCSEGDLLNYMTKRPKPSLLKQLVLMKDIAQAVEYLHGLSPKIVHRDLKPDNILIDPNGVAKLTDFGEACIWEDESKLMTDSHGTRNWQGIFIFRNLKLKAFLAPEYHRCFLEGYTEKVDIFALSLIFWQILHWAHDKIPYKYCETGIFASEVSRKQIRPSLKDLESYPKLLLTLIVAMWSPDPKERPTAKYAVFLLKQLIKKHSES